MVLFKPSSRFLILSTALTLGLAVNVPGRVQAQTAPSLSTQLSEQRENSHQTTHSPQTLLNSSFRAPERPPGQGQPVNTESGGRRGPQCIEKEDGLPVALVPASGIGETVAEYPTISWYLPKITGSIQEPAGIEFVIQDASGQQVYSASYALAQSEEGVVEAGIMSLTIPPFAKISPLEISKEYSWKLKVMCSRHDSSSFTYQLGGGLKRVAINPILERRIQQATPQERFTLYKEADVWYETLNTMLELQQQSPNDKELASAWDKLLASVGL
ncbi:MAG: DUF928 domain-containing protein [Symploca sp. SIO2C1]|nr:DUF928 domain-containing protein [Symploca sp. SIO2C1]